MFGSRVFLVGGYGGSAAVTCLWQSGVPFFYPSIEPKLGFERCEAAPSPDEYNNPEVARAHLTTGSLIAQSTVDIAVLLCLGRRCLFVRGDHLPVQVADPSVGDGGSSHAAGLASRGEADFQLLPLRFIASQAVSGLDQHGA